MKLTIQRETLLAASTRAASFTSRKNLIPALSYALIHADDNGITISATDLEKQFTERTEADVSETGSVCVPVSQVSEAVKRLPAGSLVTISTDDNQVTIRSGRYHATMNTIPVDDFPVFSETETHCEFTLPASVLRSQFQRVQFAISNEETRYYLCGVHIHTDDDKLKFVATDGHRLAVSHVVKPNMTGSLDNGVIIPRGVVADVCRLLDGDSDVRVALSDTRVVFYIRSAVVASKLIDGSFPEYKRVIPRGGDIEVTVGSALSGVIDRVAAVSSERSRPVKFAFTEAELELTCTDHNAGTAMDALEVSCNGTLDIGFQARYVQDMLSSVVGDSIWRMTDSSGPALIRDSGNEDVMFVLMPIRIS